MGTLAALALALSVYAVAAMLAQLDAVSARIALGRWEDERRLPGDAPVEAWIARLARGARVLPLDVTLALDRARLLEWRAWQGFATEGPTSASAATALGAAREGYRRALALAPTSGLVWSHRASVEARVAGGGAAARRALEQARRLAPHEPGVVARVAWVSAALDRRSSR
ncbi:MAG: hypothetical protein H6983_13705 [Ectothiorhodospiraceae bacterium]|nr:hypothetical protein [Ectothiorhodospiraceae bacterium]